MKEEECRELCNFIYWAQPHFQRKDSYCLWETISSKSKYNLNILTETLMLRLNILLFFMMASQPNLCLVATRISSMWKAIRRHLGKTIRENTVYIISLPFVRSHDN